MDSDGGVGKKEGANSLYRRRASPLHPFSSARRQVTTRVRRSRTSQPRCASNTRLLLLDLQKDSNWQRSMSHPLHSHSSPFCILLTFRLRTILRLTLGIGLFKQQRREEHGCCSRTSISRPNGSCSWKRSCTISRPTRPSASS